MKKFSIQVVIIIGVIAFAAGILTGFLLSGFPPDTTNAAGTIGKVSNYRNVSVTENDIRLRNELLQDTAQRNLLEKYFILNYAHSVETSNDIGRVLELITDVPEFVKDNQHFVASLENYNKVIEQSRLDILNTIAKLAELSSDEEEPVVSYINEAFNGMARVNSNNNILLSYANAIGKFLMLDQNKSFNTLKEAHDILLINAAKSAIISNNEPARKYLADMKLLGKEESEKGGGHQLKSTKLEKLMLDDLESLQLRSDILSGAFLDNARLAFDQSARLDMIIRSGPVINNQTSLQFVSDQESLANAVKSENLGIFDQALNNNLMDQVLQGLEIE